MGIAPIQSTQAGYESFFIQNRPKKIEESSYNRNTGPDTVSFSSEALELAGVAAAGKTAEVSAARGVGTVQATGAVQAADAVGEIEAVKKTDKELRIVEVRDEWGRLMGGLSAANMEELSSTLAEQFQSAFKKAGLDMNPPVEFSVVNGKIQAKGARNDLDEITKLVNEDPAIKENVEKLSYVTEEMTSFVKEGHLAFARAYSQSSNPNAVVAQYSHLFNGMKMPPAASTISFDGAGVSMSVAGEKVRPQDFVNNPNWVDMA